MCTALSSTTRRYAVADVNGSGSADAEVQDFPLEFSVGEISFQPLENADFSVDSLLQCANDNDAFIEAVSEATSMAPGNSSDYAAQVIVTSSSASALAASASDMTAPPSSIASTKSRWKRRRRGPQPPGKTATNKERLFVKHNYHDLADEPDAPPEDEEAQDAMMMSQSEKKKTNAPLSIDSFPMKLYRILDQIETDGLSKIVSWQPHGRAFLIRDYGLFVSIIMPRYFPKIKKITSLQRQLNLYGFERLTREGPDEGAYYHECFLRGRPELTAHRMVRNRVKGTGYKAASNPSEEPDLYVYPFVGEVIRKSKLAQQEQVQQVQLHHVQHQVAAINNQASPQDNYYQPSSQQTSNIQQFPLQESGIVTDATLRSSWTTESSTTSASSNDDAGCGQLWNNFEHQQQLLKQMQQLQQQQWQATSLLANNTNQQQGQNQNSFYNQNQATQYAPLLSSNNYQTNMPSQHFQLSAPTNDYNSNANYLYQPLAPTNNFGNAQDNIISYNPTPLMNQVQGGQGNGVPANMNEDQTIMKEFACLWGGQNIIGRLR